MKVLGIIVEYNPFHNGHLYHIRSAKELVHPDYTVAVMSGSFTQRGEPAIIDKFSRAEIAVQHGVDLVLELPFVYATQDAGGFAFGSVGLLHRIGVVSDIVFGSESSDREFLVETARILHEQPWRYQEILHVKLKKGLSFPNARKEALLEYVSEAGILDPERVKNIERSNDILGVEYVRSILRYGSSIEFHTIKRIGADYNEKDFKGKLSSATAIRKLIRDERWDLVKEAVPRRSYEVIRREISQGRGPVFWKDLDLAYMSRFRLMKREDFSRIHGFVEGLDARFEREVKRSKSLKDFIERLKTKRFTFTRLRRMMLHAFFDLAKDFMGRVNEKGPQYARILAFNENGRKLLKVMKKRSKIPLISTPSLHKKILEDLKDGLEVDEELYLRMFELDTLATDVHALFFKEEDQRVGDRDFRERVRFIRRGFS